MPPLDIASWHFSPTPPSSPFPHPTPPLHKKGDDHGHRSPRAKGDGRQVPPEPLGRAGANSRYWPHLPSGLVVCDAAPLPRRLRPQAPPPGAAGGGERPQHARPAPRHARVAGDRRGLRLRVWRRRHHHPCDQSQQHAARGLEPRPRAPAPPPVRAAPAARGRHGAACHDRKSSSSSSTHPPTHPPTLPSPLPPTHAPAPASDTSTRCSATTPSAGS